MLLFIGRGKQFKDSLKQFFKNYSKKIIRKHFNKNLNMSTENEEIFQLINNYWICDKLFDVGNKKVRDHCHITGKCRVSAHWINVNLK